MNEEIIFVNQFNKDFLIDCFNHSVHIKFDRMPDNVWYRQTSDKPLEWALENTNKVISTSFKIIIHNLKDEIEKWKNEKHIEVNLELRDEGTTYILSVEIPIEYEIYFRKTYF